MGAMLEAMPFGAVYDHPTMKFARMIDRMKEEHAELRGKLCTIAAYASAICDGEEVPEGGLCGTMRRLNDEVRLFMDRFARLAKDEDDALLPTVALYVPTGLADREQRAAMVREATAQCQAFVEQTDRCLNGNVPGCREVAGRAAAELLEACKTLKIILLEEANTIYPLAEEIIADIDYLSC